LDLGCIGRGSGGIRRLFMSRRGCGLGGLRGKLEVDSFVYTLEHSGGGGMLTET
jgi:hypothetical protein